MADAALNFSGAPSAAGAAKRGYRRRGPMR